MKTRTIELTNAGQEYPFTFSPTTVWFTLQARTSVDVRWSTEPEKVGAPATDPYVTLKAGTGFDSRYKNIPIRPGISLVLYFASDAAGTVVEIVEGY